MRSPFPRADKVPAEVLARAGLVRGDRVLAHATAADGTWLLGILDALVVVPAPTQGAPSVRVPWQQVETADWDRDEERLRVREVGEFGRVRPVHVFSLPEPGRLLQMIRERVTASVLLQRRVPVTGRQGLTVVARRSPHRDGEITWTYELDAGLDPDDPLVREAAESGLRAAQDELGAGPDPI